MDGIFGVMEVGQEQLGRTGERVLEKAGEIGFFEECRNSLF